MDIDLINKIYSRYAGWYDYFFGIVLRPGQQRAVRLMNISNGERVLEVGIGTGTSLQFYPKDTHITGIDVCRDMLTKAEQRRRKLRLKNVQLFQMDAADMQFESSSFDKVMAAHVISVVPDPPRVLKEMKRVCREGGDIFIVNQFESDHMVPARVQNAIAPICRRLGWRSALNLEYLLDQVGLKVSHIEGENMLHMWRLVKCVNSNHSAHDEVERQPLGRCAL